MKNKMRRFKQLRYNAARGGEKYLSNKRAISFSLFHSLFLRGTPNMFGPGVHETRITEVQHGRILFMEGSIENDSVRHRSKTSVCVFVGPKGTTLDPFSAAHAYLCFIFFNNYL